LNIASSVAVWKWKRRGVYVLSITTIAIFLINMWALQRIIIIIGSVGLVEIIVLAILVRPVWKYLE